MRIYEGSPRQDFEEVFRSIGAHLDRRGMREILVAEVPNGFIVQGLVLIGSGGGASNSMGQQVKETVTFLDHDISRFMDEGQARRTGREPVAPPSPGYYERALRVIGRYMDEQKPRDVFFFEQDGSFVVRLLKNDMAGSRHVLSEFLREDVDRLVRAGPTRRKRDVEPRAKGR
jgi:hypothetical protein